MRDCIERLVIEAGEIVMPYFGNTSHVEKTSRADVLTEADLASERHIIESIRHDFPDDNIFSEEAGGIKDFSGRTWIVDPIDGTHNFSRHLPVFAIMVALVENEKVMHSAIRVPVTKETFSASRGEGAYRDGERITCSTHAAVDDSVGHLDFPWDDPTWEEAMIAVHDRILRENGSLKDLFSIGVSGAQIACGRSDHFFGAGARIWDYAPISLILEEAGCIVTGLDGKPWTITEPSLLAANPMLHAQLLRHFTDAKER